MTWVLGAVVAWFAFFFFRALGWRVVWTLLTCGALLLVIGGIKRDGGH